MIEQTICQTDHFPRSEETIEIKPLIKPGRILGEKKPAGCVDFFSAV